jgi:hypothetical protein
VLAFEPIDAFRVLAFRLAGLRVRNDDHGIATLLGLDHHHANLIASGLKSTFAFGRS